MNLKVLEMFKLGRNLRDYSVYDLLRFEKQLRDNKIIKVSYQNTEIRTDLFYYNYNDDDIHLILENMLYRDLIPKRLLDDYKAIAEEEKENYLYIAGGYSINLKNLIYKHIEIEF